jgi:hypothetical protein
VSKKSLHSVYEDKPWISLIDYLVKPNIHYINLNMKYLSTHYNDTKENKLKCDNYNYKEFEKITKKLKLLYDNQEKIKIIKENLVKLLNMEHIYKYIFDCLLENEKLISTN